MTNNPTYNYLHERNARLTLMEKGQILDSLTEVEASSAWIDMMLKVKSSNSSEEVSNFWKDNLIKVERVINELRDVKGELSRLETEYQKLYSRYLEVVELNRKLEKEF